MKNGNSKQVLGKINSMNDKQKIVSNADTSYGNERL